MLGTPGTMTPHLFTKYDDDKCPAFYDLGFPMDKLSYGNLPFYLGFPTEAQVKRQIKICPGQAKFENCFSIGQAVIEVVS